MNKLDLLRKTLEKINSMPVSKYNWKAMGACNCGNLVQVATGYTAKEISNFGIKKHGDWYGLTKVYIKDSGYEIDNIITKLLNVGFSIEDFIYLENLNDPEIIGEHSFKKDSLEDYKKYLKLWIAKIEDETIKNIKLPENLFESENTYKEHCFIE